MLFDFGKNLPEQVFLIKPQSVLFCDYDEILFGTFWKCVCDYYKSQSKIIKAYLISREMIDNNQAAIPISSMSSDYLSDVLQDLGFFESVYECQGFFVWDYDEMWGVCASRDLEIALVGIYDSKLKPYLEKCSLGYADVIDIIAGLVYDKESVEKKMRINYGAYITGANDTHLCG